MPDVVDTFFKQPTTRSRTALAAAQREAGARSRGWCEAAVTGICPPTRHPGEQFHHVRLRSQGGEDTASNLLHLCLRAHTWAHANPARAEQLGIIRRSA